LGGGEFVDIPDLRLGPPRLAFGTPRGSRDPRLRTTGLVNESDNETFSAIMKPYIKRNGRSYLLKFLTPVMVVINCPTVMSVVVVIR